MGLLDRIIGAVNRGHAVVSDAGDAVLRDRGFERADALSQSGSQVEGAVTGIHYDLEDSTTVAHYRVEWNDPEPRVAALRFGATAPDVLRLGSTVPLRVDADRAALDLALLGLTDAGRASGRVPDPGVVDASIDSGVRRHLDRWRGEEAHVVQLDRATALGMSTDGWMISLRRADDAAALARNVWVPPYAHRLVHPEAWVPVAVDPADPTRAVVDWPALAVARAGGTWRDPLPPGCVAEIRRSILPAPADSAVVGGEAVLTPSADSVEAIEGVTLDEWALIEASMIKDRVPPQQYDAYATEHFEVHAGRWGAIKAQWEARMHADWRVGAAFGESFERSRKELKKRR